MDIAKYLEAVQATINNLDPLVDNSRIQKLICK
jgi:hypothetical protein